MPAKSFERFYYEKIAISEGCGCAEQFIGTRDLDTRLHEMPLAGSSDEEPGGRFAWLNHLIRGWGKGKSKALS